MSPIEIVNVDPMNVWTYITIGLGAAIALCVILAGFDKFLEYRSNAKGNPVISMTHWTLMKWAFILTILALSAYAFSTAVYDSSVDESGNQAIAQLEQKTGVSILNKGSIGAAEIVKDENSIPVSFKYEDKAYEGTLIIEDGGLLLYVENPAENGKELVVFEG